MAANQLAMGCVDAATLPAVGGWTATGNGNGLRITMKGYSRRGFASNGTGGVDDQ